MKVILIAIVIENDSERDSNCDNDSDIVIVFRGAKRSPSLTSS